jgi:alkylhydroperoxidase family enzyme
MSLRLAVAKDEGLDEVMAAKVDRYEASDLPDHHKAALRLADALMTQPGGIDASLRDELRRHFSDDQLVELTVDVMKWNYQKVTVALGTDDEVRPGQLTDLLFDDEGNWVRPG